jgi:ankyrin repeat protein
LFRVDEDEEKPRMGKIHRGSRWLVSVGVIAAVSASLAIWWVSPSQRLKRQVDALVAAAISGDAKAVETALAGGVDVNCRDARGITVLMHAARGDRPKIADPTPTDHPEVVELLIKRGAGVNAKTDTGFVALFWAARYGHERVAKVLIDNGADVNAKDKDGITALKWATPNKHTAVIALLRAAGAKE